MVLRILLILFYYIELNFDYRFYVVIFWKRKYEVIVKKMNIN